MTVIATPRNSRALRVLVLGIRGMPQVQGGVETHAEQLYQRLAERGCSVEVLVRTPFTRRGVRTFGAIRLRRLWAPSTPGLEALVHSILGVLYAAVARPDILHIHSIGPAIVTPIARLFGLRVVVTYHSQNYHHEKWGRSARWLLRAGEYLGMRTSHARIAVSKAMQRLILSRHHRDAWLIPNGVAPARVTAATDELSRLGLSPGGYVLQVGRIAPEKRQLDLIAAYASIPAPGWKLVLVGGLDESDYSHQVRDAAARAGAVLAGYLNGDPLAQLYTCARAFVLPSSHEGMPIALLEALSYGLPVVASDIEANRELELDQECYFPVGDRVSLGGLLQRVTRPVDDPTADAAQRASRRLWVTRNFDWDAIATRTLEVYESVRKR